MTLVQHLLVTGLFIAAATFPISAQEQADRIFLNGKIITVDEAFSIQQAMAIKENRILAVGTDEEMKPYISSETEVIDLMGKIIMPGLIDSHAHPADACMTEFDHPIPEMQNIADVLGYIRQRAEVLEDGEWIWVSQVFLTRLEEERYPTREELDQAAPKNPVVFRTGPDASVNSLALKLSGIGKGWKVDDGGPGYIETDPETGEPTGILRSCTRYLKYKSSAKQPTQEEHLQKLKELIRDYNSVGITGITERDGSSDEIELYKKLFDQQELSIRAFLSRHVDTIQSTEDIRKAVQEVSHSPLYQDNPWLSLRTIKVYMDGGMLTGSAYMREPWGVSRLYNISDPEYRGLRFVPEEKLIPLLEACMENNVQFTAHSVGDGAVHAIIDACAQLQDRFNIRQQRPVLCHSNFMSAEAVSQAAELGVCMDIQPAWLYLDGRTLTNHFGYDRLAYFQPLRSIFAAGAVAGGGSDHMQKIGSLRSNNFYNPWKGMWVAMTRSANWLDKPLHPEQALSRVEAIRFYTINNAYLTFSEKERGSLEPGKLADFIVLETDPLTCPLDEFKDISVLQTYIDGKVVHSRN
ncbi:MAG: amidohydrolase [bacterium]|jgi:predicted amidohydrolase YtcJ